MTVFARLKTRRTEARDAAATLTAPLSGLVVKLEDIPDAAFAGGMLGDGVAIDPTDATLVAPCDGEVIAVAEARHAVTLRAPNGAEILMHVGIDTVALGGDGFTALVAKGARVRTGDPLIVFDMDNVAMRAKSLVSPIILLNGEAFAVARRTSADEVAAGAFLMEMLETSAAGARAARPAEGETRASVTVRLPHGIHARPAAQIAAEAKRSAGEIEIRAGTKIANARSVSALMALGTKCGDEVSIVSRGGRAAIDAISAILAAGEIATTAQQKKADHARPAAAPISAPTILAGIAATSGLGIGQALLISEQDLPVEEEGKGADVECAALARAIGAVRRRLQAAGGARAASGIFAAHLALLEDPELAAAADRLIAVGKSGAYAWRAAMRAQADRLAAMTDARMAERAADFRDLERQVIAALKEDNEAGEIAEGSVLVADEIYPSQLLRLDAKRIAGICMAGGGPTSHASILAASLGIPTVVALGPAVLGAKAGTTVIVDAGKAEVYVAPDAKTVDAVRSRQEQRARQRAQALASAKEDCRTADDVRIEVLANLVSTADAEAAAANFAEGCGLLRTEFLFLGRATPPEEAEQAAQYRAISRALKGRPVTIRTLDVGADKSVPYLPLDKEENPALGLRGVRVSLARPDLLETQLRAILAAGGARKIMIPMITGLAELRAVRGMLDRLREETRTTEKIPLGVMIETPAAAILASEIAAEADFLSIGSNDLAQYVLAMDRGNPKVAAGIDALNPAVLRLIALAGEGGAKRGKPVSVCGGLASDFEAGPILIGMGVGALSATPARIPELKAFIRTLKISDCRVAARKAVELDSAAAVRALSRETWPQLGDWI